MLFYRLWCAGHNIVFTVFFRMMLALDSRSPSHFFHSSCVFLVHFHISTTGAAFFSILLFIKASSCFQSEWNFIITQFYFRGSLLPERPFTIWAPKFWNSLPEDLSLPNFVSTFYIATKNFL